MELGSRTIATTALSASIASASEGELSLKHFCATRRLPRQRARKEGPSDIVTAIGERSLFRGNGVFQTRTDGPGESYILTSEVDAPLDSR